jgi:hypothetical protein
MHSLHLFRHSKQVQRAAAHCHATVRHLATCNAGVEVTFIVYKAKQQTMVKNWRTR